MNPTDSTKIIRVISLVQVFICVGRVNETSTILFSMRGYFFFFDKIISLIANEIKCVVLYFCIFFFLM